VAGYQTIEALRPILHKGPPATPVLDRMLFYKPRTKASPSLDEIARAVAWRKEGMSNRAIAKKLGHAQSTFKRYTKDIPPPPGGWSNGSRKSRVTAAQIAKAERMARAGFTWVEIAEDLGCAKSTIRTAVGRDKRHRTRETDLSKVVRAVRDVTGIPAALLRSDCESSAKVPARVARARHIVFWMAHHQFGIAPDVARRVAEGVRMTPSASLLTFAAR
jgi:predicted transcriptional regulator